MFFLGTGRSFRDVFALDVSLASNTTPACIDRPQTTKYSSENYCQHKIQYFLPFLFTSFSQDWARKLLVTTRSIPR
ncbi:MAG: hypothetical protein D6725_05365 [Planctomycetota bacterium]|nr:MAG: hypothetical protein D6725_05365 [Planctomycetota bacterium]